MKSKGFHPTEIIFSSTTACNLHCEHCFINRTPHKLEIADVVKLIESCVESGGQPGPDGTPLPVIDRIGFSGGEPFLYMDFLIEVTKAAISNDLMFDQIMTNGDWWRDESDLSATLQKLYDAGYDGKIGLSWDSYHGQTTDRMETFIRKVQKIFGEESINIQTVDSSEGESVARYPFCGGHPRNAPCRHSRLPPPPHLHLRRPASLEIPPLVQRRLLSGPGQHSLRSRRRKHSALLWLCKRKSSPLHRHNSRQLRRNYAESHLQSHDKTLLRRRPFPLPPPRIKKMPAVPKKKASRNHRRHLYSLRFCM